MQRDINSVKLDTGVQFYILLLIAAVVVLVFVMLHERQVLDFKSDRFLRIAQIVLLVAGVLSMLVTTLAERSRLFELTKDSQADTRSITREGWVSQALDSLESAANVFDYAGYSLQMAQQTGAPSPECDSVRAARTHNRQLAELRSAIAELDRLRSEVDTHLRDLGLLSS